MLEREQEGSKTIDFAQLDSADSAKFFSEHDWKLEFNPCGKSWSFIKTYDARYIGVSRRIFTIDPQEGFVSLETEHFWSTDDTWRPDLKLKGVTRICLDFDREELIFESQSGTYTIRHLGSQHNLQSADANVSAEFHP